MLRINRQNHALTRLTPKSIPDAGLRERADLQRMIRQSHEAFFQEMGEKLLLVGEEVKPADFVADRIDLLAIDENGSTVVIELKRGSDKLQLLQALGYAGMVAKWNREQLVSALGQFEAKPISEAEDQIEEFLQDGIGELNQTQRVVLLAENFDYEVLVTAEWLTEKYGVDIRCYRLTLSEDGPSEFLSCTCIYPPPEITQVATRRGIGPREPSGPGWADWDEALADVQNPAVVQFYREELAAGRPSSLGRRVLRYHVRGRHVFNIVARRKLAYVWQERRFKDDESYWGDKLSEPGQVGPVRRGEALRLFLKTPEDFERFRSSFNADANRWEFVVAADAEIDPAGEGEPA
jgi:hypothetical protein